MRVTATPALADRLGAFARSYLTWRDCPPDEYEAFARYARATCVRHAPYFLGAFLAAVPVYYVVDRLALGGGPELAASLRWRLGIGVMLSLGLAAALAMRATRRDEHAYAIGIAGGTLMCAFIGASTSPDVQLGSVTTAGFLVLPLFSVPALGGLAFRCAATLAPAAGVLAGFVLRQPSHLREPGFAHFASVMAFTSALSITIGHVLSHTVRRGFLLSRQLGALAESLERRVRDRTREVRELFDHLEDAKEEERLRIARDVHDELGQYLSASALSLDRARTLEPGPARDEEYARARELLAGAIGSVRGVLAGMRPRALEETGVAGAFELLLDQHERATGAECLWSLELDASALPPAHGVAVFRVLQECLRNAERHARARRVDVLLASEPGAVRLEVRDDGVGFDVEARREGSFGVLGMRERARALGGELDVRSAPGEGTTVTMVLPVARSQR